MCEELQCRRLISPIVLFCYYIKNLLVLLPTDSPTKSRDCRVGEPTGLVRSRHPAQSRVWRPIGLTAFSTPVPGGDVESSFASISGVFNLRGGDSHDWPSIIGEYLFTCPQQVQFNPSDIGVEPITPSLPSGGPPVSRVFQSIQVHESHQCLFPNFLYPAIVNVASMVPELTAPAVSRRSTGAGEVRNPSGLADQIKVPPAALGIQPLCSGPQGLFQSSQATHPVFSLLTSLLF